MTADDITKIIWDLAIVTSHNYPPYEEVKNLGPKHIYGDLLRKVSDAAYRIMEQIENE